MKCGLLSIGQMAKLNHTTVPTLRLYDKMGLLRPCRTDPETGYRYYDIKQNARFDMIQYMKELGMSLHEIQTVFSKENVRLIEDILIRKREQLFEQMRQMKLRRDAISRAIASIERYCKSPTEGVTSLEYIDRRRIYAIPSSRNFYLSGIDAYEEVLCELREKMIEKGVPPVYYYSVGTSMLKEDFEHLRFRAHEIFAFVDDHFPARSETRTLESGMYACIYLSSYEDEMPYAEKLLAFCEQHGYQPSGDYVCEVMTEFNIFDEEQRSMFLRLQVPVSFSNTNSNP